jgi:hypothetical protein
MRVLFTSPPLYGHFHPLVPYARALADAGHEVVFAAPAALAEAVLHAGLRHFPAGLNSDHPSIHPACPARRCPKSPLLRAIGVFALGLVPLLLACGPPPGATGATTPELGGRLIAVGIPGAGAISAVGTFHPGGPIRDKPEFAAFTQAGAVLDPARILVASASNFGAPLGKGDQPAGAILSIDPRSPTPLVVPAQFAAADGQVAALDGKVRLFSAQSPNFLNKANNPGALTADLPPVANPSGISINNAFGRLWFANVPARLAGPSTETVIDPDGRPLAGPPNKVAGGVFAGDQTNRAPQRAPGGLTTGAVGNAFLGKSPDGSGRAVFAVALADGGLVQVHVEKGVDGLAPAGTIRATADGAPAARVGVLFNWVPDPILFVSDPLANAVVALTLATDGELFRVSGNRRLAPKELDVPVDLAPAVPEVANPGFSSNTTLAGASDLYVVNRGNGTIVRLRQDGTVLAVRQVSVPGLGRLGADRLNGIAVSPDAARLWVSVSGAIAGFAGAEGAVVELPTFGAPAPGAGAATSTAQPR